MVRDILDERNEANVVVFCAGNIIRNTIAKRKYYRKIIERYVIKRCYVGEKLHMAAILLQKMIYIWVKIII